MPSLPNFFFLLISPPPEVIDWVASWKQLIWKRIGHSYQSRRSLAHLSLRMFYDGHNESLLYDFAEKISVIRSFRIYIHDFKFFGNNGTIYLNIFGAEWDQLSTQIAGRPLTPHITIARNLSPRDFQVVWEMFRDLSYRNSFVCKHVTVLKRFNNLWQSHTILPLAQ